KRRGSAERVSHEICRVKSSEDGTDPLRTHEDLTLRTQAIITRRLRVGLQLLGFLLLASHLGCSHARNSCQEGLAQRILPPVNLDVHEELPTPKKTTQETSVERAVRYEQPIAVDDTVPKEIKQAKGTQGSDIACEPTLTLTLTEAIDTA